LGKKSGLAGLSSVRRSGRTISPPWPEAGIARENVTRVLTDWQRHKVVSRLSDYYCLENKAQLEHQVKF
jgi:hypothetical protein